MPEDWTVHRNDLGECGLNRSAILSYVIQGGVAVVTSTAGFVERLHPELSEAFLKAVRGDPGPEGSDRVLTSFPDPKSFFHLCRGTYVFGGDVRGFTWDDRRVVLQVDIRKHGLHDSTLTLRNVEARLFVHWIGDYWGDPEPPPDDHPDSRPSQVC